MSYKPSLEIPTTYKGVRMRSRTEARWAAFFDAIEWDWHYEPFDLYGYVPDFVISHPAGDLIVEVKGPLEEMALAESKIEVSGWQKEALVVAATLDGPVIGRLLETTPDGPTWTQAELFRCLSCNQVSVLATEGSWRCRACGCYGGNTHVGDYDPATEWAQASNRVQWRAAG